MDHFSSGDDTGVPVWPVHCRDQVYLQERRFSENPWPHPKTVLHFAQTLARQ
jgi:hypothetical protein